MAIQPLNNSETGQVIRGKINDNFAICLVKTTSEIFPTKESYQVFQQVVGPSANDKPIEILNIGYTGHGPTDDIHSNFTGLVRINGRLGLNRNVQWDAANSKWVTPLKSASAYGSASLEIGGEAVILHASPAGVDLNDVPHEIFMASANGTDGETNHKVTTGYFSQSKACIYARFNSTAYDPAATNNAWNQISGVNPLMWLSSGEVKNTINEFALLETNSATAGAWPGMYFGKSRGTLASKAAAADADILGVIGFKGHDGTAYQITAGIKAVVSGAVSTGVVPTRLQFETSPTNTAGKAVLLDLNNGNAIGFFGVTPVTRPVVPTGSTTDTLITALQNLGLISQT